MSAFTLMLLVLCLLLPACGNEDKTTAETINVSIQLRAHNIARNGFVQLSAAKQTADGTVKGEADLSGNADAFGDYVPTALVNYNLNDRNDKVNIDRNYTLSPHHGGTLRQGTSVLTYDDLAPYNGRSLTVDLEYQDPTVQHLWEAWYNQRDLMTYCFDLPYYYLLGHAPPADESEAVTRQRVADALSQQGYTRSVSGPLNSSLFVQDGDIVLFGASAEPDPVTAPHFAVVADGKIWGVFHWTGGGDFDGPRDPGFFLNRPPIENPYTGAVTDPPVPFLYYAIYSR